MNEYDIMILNAETSNLVLCFSVNRTSPQSAYNYGVKWSNDIFKFKTVVEIGDHDPEFMAKINKGGAGSGERDTLDLEKHQ